MKEKEVRDKESRDLEMNKLSVEDVKARNEELARMKTLLFYQEQKNKRINKIKSKKYHKIRKRAPQGEGARADQANGPRAVQGAVGEGCDQARQGTHVVEAQEHLKGTESFCDVIVVDQACIATWRHERRSDPRSRHTPKLTLRKRLTSSCARASVCARR